MERKLNDVQATLQRSVRKVFFRFRPIFIFDILEYQMVAKLAKFVHYTSPLRRLDRMLTRAMVHFWTSTKRQSAEDMAHFWARVVGCTTSFYWTWSKLSHVWVRPLLNKVKNRPRRGSKPLRKNARRAPDLLKLC